MKNIYYESEKDKNNILYAKKQKEYNSLLHFHRAFELAYIIEGSADYVVEDEHFHLEPDEICFSNCYYLHKSLPEPKHEKYVIIVPEKISSEIYILFREKTLPSHLKDKEFNKTLLPYIEKIIDSDNISPIITKGFVDVILGSLFDHYGEVTPKRKNKNMIFIEKILLYLDEHYSQPITLKQTASALGYNRSYFSYSFNRYMGISFNNYLNNLRLDRFEMLHEKYPKESITDLAYDCGFSSVATFYRAKKAREEERNK